MLLPALQRGLAKVLRRPQLLWTITLALIIIVAFVIVATMFFTVAKDAQERLVNVRIGSIHDALVPVVKTNISDSSLIQDTLESVAVNNSTLQLFRVGLIQNGDLVVVASLDKSEVGSLVPYQSFQTGLAIQDPNNSYTFELTEKDDRFFQTVRSFEGDNYQGLIIAEQTLSQADRQLNSALIRSLIVFIFIMLVVLTLFIRHSRIIDYISLYRKLKEVDEFKDNFLSMATHELRTPLTAIRGYIDLVKDDKTLSKETSANIKTIDTVSKQLTDLIEDMLEVSRIEQGRLKIKKEKLNARSVISEVIDTLVMTAEHKGLKLVLLQGPDGLIKVDRDRFRQILINIVGNAIKYTPQGEVKVETKLEDTDFVIRVSDTGVGMSQEEQEQLFEKFYRVRNQDTKKIRGSGLGLWITKQLVEKMDGKISVESIKNVGTHFVIKFPINE